MYLGNDNARGYYRGTEQCTSRGNFLILAHPKHDRCLTCGEDRDVLANPRDYDTRLASDGKYRKFCLKCDQEICDSLHFPIRAFVRKVALQQCGHWMMGRVNIGGKWYTVSGAYGDDGLTMNLPYDTYMRGVVLPQELYNAWAQGGGHNSCGSEAPLMREWAIKTFCGRKVA